MSQDPAPTVEGPEAAGDEELKWPLGFVTFSALAGLYLVWRLIQAVGWMIDRFA